MPSPLLQLRIPQDLADWLEAKYPSRGEVAEYVRQLLTAEQMKEAVAPLVPEDYEVVQVGAFLMAKEDAEKAGFEFPAEPKPKARRKKVTVGDLESDEPIDLMVALKASVEAMKSVEGSGMPSPMSGQQQRETKPPRPAVDQIENPPRLLRRCNRGVCGGTIKPNGRCIRCNQKPLGELQ